MTSHIASPLLVWTSIALVSALAIAGEVLIAGAMRQLGDLDIIRSRSGLPGAVRAVLSSPVFLAGAFCMAVNFFAMLYTLSHVDLSLAMPGIASFTYVGQRRRSTPFPQGKCRPPSLARGLLRLCRRILVDEIDLVQVMKPILFALLALSSLLAAAAQTRPAPDGLSIYFIDVEGGQATLFVTPAHESLLVDTGWNGHDNRDADRIAAAAHQAGLTRIDFVLITHFHDDHVGGVPQLIAKIPVGTFIDHGPNRELNNQPTVNAYSEFVNVLATNPVKEIIAKPGDHLPIRGFDATVISADGKVLARPLAGAGQPNAFCKSSPLMSPDQTENARSLGIEITFGKLKILDLGDLTMDKERDLMCPLDKLGRVDILIVSHHGWYQSSSPALIDAIRPRVAIMDNGADKGGSPSVFETLAAAPGLEQLWQVHYSNEAKELNVPEKFIANVPGPDSANFLLLTGSRDGSFSVLNSRNGFTEPFPAGH